MSRTISTTTLLTLFVAFTGLACTASGQTVADDFETDPAGWTSPIRTGEDAIEWHDSGGDPDGYISVTRESRIGSSNFFIAPDRYHGDWSAAFDSGGLRLSWQNSNPGGFGISLESTGPISSLSVLVDESQLVAGEWNQVEILFADLDRWSYCTRTRECFNPTPAEMIVILSQITGMMVGRSSFELETASLDSFRMFTDSATQCLADLDGDGELSIFDFLAFQNLFDAMGPAADFDGDGDFTIFDFLAFQNVFDAGCP